MPNQNPFFETATIIGEELYETKRKGENIFTVEFGMQEASRAQWRDAVKSDPFFEKQEWKRMGSNGFLKAIMKNTGGK